MTDELVLGLARERVMSEGDWRGLRTQGLEATLGIIEREGEFRPRAEVEDDPSFKQIIPYLMVRDADRLFLMRRTRAGTDARLHERYSLGVGGHVNPEDSDLRGGLNREWSEELEADFEPRFRLLGLLNDDRDPVGAVHLGVVYETDAAGRFVAVRERHKLSGEFVTPRAVADVADGLESWSALLYEALISPVAVR